MKSRRSWIYIASLLVLTEAMYVRPAMLTGSASLIGLDYLQLHIRRIAFARDALFGARHTVPAWYPHELLGTPFAANLQNFPWIPTRLILLFLDPALAYGVGVAIAAGLAALFTYLYCRRAGLSEIGAATAGWTFSCAGYFACRVTAGHLPLLEAYPALPLLLWLADRAISRDRDRYEARDQVILALACASVALAGHPQLPAYALAAALLYVVLRSRGWLRIRVISAMALGVGMTLAAWWPMLLLVERSTRVLDLAPPANDISMPYGRLPALFRPGIDGWPDIIDLSDANPFEGYPNDSYFWDTTAYIGLLPLLVIVVLLVLNLVKKRVPRWPWSFLALLGVGSLILALPVTDPLRRIIPGTFLRSPARLLYLSTFAAAVALGFGVSAFLKSSVMTLRKRQAVVACFLIFHIVDLGGFSRVFIRTLDQQPSEAPPFAGILNRETGDGRVALSGDLVSTYNDRYDDAGVFDSVLLANPYRAILGLNGDSPELNTQRLDGAEFSVPALQGAGARFVVTTTERTDLELVSGAEETFLYRVPDPAPRAAFFTMDRTEFMPRKNTLKAFVSRARQGTLLLPEEARLYVSHTRAVYVSDKQRDQTSIKYLRPSSDEIRIEAASDQSGFVSVLESFDPGWRAEVDGKQAPVILANGFSMAVPVVRGSHVIVMWYKTPGRTWGEIFSLVSAGLLLGSILIGRRGSRRLL